jgi:hypothetical protein
MDHQIALYPELIALAQEMFDSGAEIEPILEALRSKSPSIIQSMKVMRDILNLPMSEAKNLVHHSRAWSDMRDVHSELHEQAEAALRYPATLNSDGSFRAEIDLNEEQ